jgi:hypothetical protein
MLAALIAGQRDPKVLAELALGRLRPKVGALEQALVGRFADHHGRLCSKMLAHIDSLTAAIEELTRGDPDPDRAVSAHPQAATDDPRCQRSARRDPHRRDRRRLEPVPDTAAAGVVGRHVPR